MARSRWRFRLEQVGTPCPSPPLEFLTSSPPCPPACHAAQGRNEWRDEEGKPAWSSGLGAGHSQPGGAGDGGPQCFLTPLSVRLQLLLSEGHPNLSPGGAGSRHGGLRPAELRCSRPESRPPPCPNVALGRGSRRAPRAQVLPACGFPWARGSFLLGTNLHGWPGASPHHPPGCP